MAILDTRLAFEYANAAMREVMHLPEDIEGRELSSVLRGIDASGLVAVLDKSLRRRRSLENVLVELEAGSNVQTFQVHTSIGRNRAGHISYLLVTLTRCD